MSSEPLSGKSATKESAAARYERIDEALLNNEMRLDEQDQKITNLTTVVETGNHFVKQEFKKMEKILNLLLLSQKASDQTDKAKDLPAEDIQAEIP